MYSLVPRISDRSTLEDCCEAEGNQSGTDLNDERPADYSELFLRKDVEIKEQKRQFRYGDSVLDKALEDEKV